MRNQCVAVAVLSRRTQRDCLAAYPHGGAEKPFKLLMAKEARLHFAAIHCCATKTIHPRRRPDGGERNHGPMPQAQRIKVLPTGPILHQRFAHHQHGVNSKEENQCMCKNPAGVLWTNEEKHMHSSCHQNTPSCPACKSA